MPQAAVSERTGQALDLAGGDRMYISSVHVENFRNLRDCLFTLQPGLNVLVGRNNVGKSNLVTAIRHAFGPNASAGDLSRLERSDFREKDGSPQPMKITLTFDALSTTERTTFFEMLVPNLDDIAKSPAQLVFEATWNRSRPRTRRWCGPERADGSSVPNELLEALPITFLPALRDAEGALTPGYRNRLARLFEALAADSDREEILGVFEQANAALEKQSLISGTLKDVRDSAQRMSGTDYLAPSIRAAEPEIHRILRSLRLVVDTAPIADIGASGLGYQNILYVATVLAHLTKASDEDLPLLMVEEPEAHLHPQLVVLLADSLSAHEPGRDAPQTIVTTHSPTFTAHVEPEQLSLMTTDREGYGRVQSIRSAGMGRKEARAVQRMMDVTRSALYFAKGAILVEGLSEALLIPAFAARLGHDLKDAHVSVLPICGVAFSTLAKLLREAVLGSPVAIISDGDPTLAYDDPEKRNWRTARPAKAVAGFEECERLIALREHFSDHDNVRVFSSQVTLEYDLADAGEENPLLMAAVWESIFEGTPGTLTKSIVADAADHNERVLSVWRGICVAKSSGSKADFAHRLAAALEADDGPDTSRFQVPVYIKQAIEFVMDRTAPRTDLLAANQDSAHRTDER